MNLLLCSGAIKWDGWTSLDANPTNNPDICCSIPPIPSGPWEEIALIHGIEHFDFWVAPTLIKNCYDSLEEGGKLILEQPNLEVCCKVILGQMTTPPENFDGQFGIVGIFGDPSYKSPLMMHRWAYSPASLEALVRDAGFRTIEHLQPQFHIPFRDFRVEATK